jgi:hypothetical protein
MIHAHSSASFPAGFSAINGISPSPVLRYAPDHDLPRTLYPFEVHQKRAQILQFPSLKGLDAG